MQVTDGIFYVIVLMMSVIVHEVSHGYTAYLLGDDTAYKQGRLTLNPLKHLDPIGSILLPMVLYLSYPRFTFGWARPVPYNPDNFRNKRTGTMLVASAGIIANILLALIFGLMIRFAPNFGLPALSSDPLLINPFYKIATIIVTVNLVLAIFNLIPIPPLDGSKILFSVLPARFAWLESYFMQGSLQTLLIFMVILFISSSFLLSYLIGPLLSIIFHLITGYSL